MAQLETCGVNVRSIPMWTRHPSIMERLQMFEMAAGGEGKFDGKVVRLPPERDGVSAYLVRVVWTYKVIDAGNGK